jgi:imidazole glycerol-phosphate synthase subunit HisF
VRVRVIPILLLHRGGLVKSVRFTDYKYIGDPINTVKIFNEKEVDEIAIVDIDATRDNRRPNFSQLSEIVSEAFMPVAYGGGISTIEDMREVLVRGVEKVILNKILISRPAIVSEGARLFGSQSIVASIDVRKKALKGYRVYSDNGRVDTGFSPITFAKQLEDLGAGEILLNCIDRDGTYKGYDVDLVSKVSHAVNIPVIAAGGAGSIEDFRAAYKKGASAVAAGSMFVFKRPYQAVLVSYPDQSDLNEKLFNQIL